MMDDPRIPESSEPEDLYLPPFVYPGQTSSSSATPTSTVVETTTRHKTVVEPATHKGLLERMREAPEVTDVVRHEEIRTERVDVHRGLLSRRKK